MIRGTTPPIKIKLPNNVSNYKVIKITFESILGKIKVEKDLDEMEIIDSQTIQFRLSQDETLSFDPSDRIKVQIRAVTNDDLAYATKICYIYVGDPYSYVSRLKAQGKNVILPEHYEYPGAYTGIPSLYISATQDKFCSKEEIPQEATEIKEFDCGHIMGLSSFKEEYISTLDSFLKNNL